VAVAMMPQPATSDRKADGIMNDDVKDTIDQLANSLQTVTLLSTQLRRELGNSAQQAIDLETAAGRAVSVIKKLQPRKKDQ
jgi:hypothetical protein